MKVLVACEYSGTVRDAFIRAGHDAMSCDLLDTDTPGPHYKGDVRDVLYSGWDLMIAHPPCTYLSRAGARWWKDQTRNLLSDAAAEFVFELRDCGIKRIAIENPIGQLNKRWRYPDQTIQPYQFGHPFSKATCLWLKGLPLLMPTNIVSEYTPFCPSNTGAGKRKGQSSSLGVATDWKTRSATFGGIAAAMADQWGQPTRPIQLGVNVKALFG
jgi:hypothetical protein